jgi:hypothetical protein
MEKTSIFNNIFSFFKPITDFIKVNACGYTKIDHVCSLGRMCFSSNLIKRNKLKRESYPFDWIFSTPKMIMNCIEDDFNRFLDKKSYTVHEYEPLERKCGHAEYNLAMFNHHNPKDFEEDYEYFKRCIERFYRLVDSEDNKLFIMTFQNNSDNEDEFRYCKNDVIEFSKKFRKHCSGKFYLFVIYHIIDVKTFHEFEYSDNVIFCKLHNGSKSNGVDFTNPVDNEYIDSVLSETYVFDIKNV